MKDGPDIARIASLIGEPARANMLTALMAGRALTASELAHEAGITPQTAATHLGRLEQGGLVHVRRQGRHKYFSLAGAEVAAVLEALMGLAAGSGHLRTRPGPRDDAMRRARVCYNHLAGEKGTQLYDRMTALGCFDHGADGPLLTARGERFATGLGIDLASLRSRRAALCRECLDWSERRPHLGGSLGRAFLQRFESLGWVRRIPDSRALRFTATGDTGFAGLLDGPASMGEQP